MQTMASLEWTRFLPWNRRKRVAQSWRWRWGRPRRKDRWRAAVLWCTHE